MGAYSLEISGERECEEPLLLDALIPRRPTSTPLSPPAQGSAGSPACLLLCSM